VQLFVRSSLCAAPLLCGLLMACSATPPEKTSTSQPSPNAQPANAPGQQNTTAINTNYPPANPQPANVKAVAQQSTIGRYQGFFDDADCKTVWGWVWNQNQQPNAIESVEILSDGVPIATVPAGQPRWSVAQVTRDSGNHGFVYPIPNTLKNGKPHVIRIRVANTNFELQNSPRTIKCRSRRSDASSPWAHLY